jgi:hypothetical protein
LGFFFSSLRVATKPCGLLVVYHLLAIFRGRMMDLKQIDRKIVKISLDYVLCLVILSVGFIQGWKVHLRGRIFQQVNTLGK